MFPLYILGFIRPLQWQPAAHWSARGKQRVRVQEINVISVNDQRGKVCTRLRLTVVLICLKN